MKKLSISETFRFLLQQQNNISVSEVSRQTNIPQPTLHHLLSGNTKKPRGKVLEKLAQFFSISMAQLTGEKPLYSKIPSEIKKTLGIATVPIISWNNLLEWPIQDYSFNQEILLDKEVSNYSYALKMDSSNLEPIFPQDSLLIFDFEKKPKDRDYILLYCFQEKRFILNKLFIEESGDYIKAEQFPTKVQLLKINREKDKFLGTLIEVRLQTHFT